MTPLRPVPDHDGDPLDELAEQQRADRGQGAAARKAQLQGLGPLELVRRALDLPTLGRGVKRAQRDALYDLELEDGTLIPLGSVSQVRDPRKVDDAIADATGQFPATAWKPSEFRDVANAILAISELEDGGATPDSLTCGWLAAYTNDRLSGTIDLATADGRTEAAKGRDAFRSADERLHVYLPDFERFVRVSERVPTTTRDLAARLARLGFTNAQIEAPRGPDGRKTARRRYWASPADFDPADRA